MHPGQKLLAWRLASKLSQREAADLAGLSQPIWHTYESDPKRRPKIDAALAIERATNGAVCVADWVRPEKERDAKQRKTMARRVDKSDASAPKLAKRRARKAA